MGQLCWMEKHGSIGHWIIFAYGVLYLGPVQLGAVAIPTLLAALLVDLAVRLSFMGSEDRYVADTGRRSISCFLSSSLVAARHDSEARRATGGCGKPTPHRIPGPRHGALCPLTGGQTFRQALGQVPYAS